MRLGKERLLANRHADEGVRYNGGQTKLVWPGRMMIGWSVHVLFLVDDSSVPWSPFSTAGQEQVEMFVFVFEG